MEASESKFDLAVKEVQGQPKFIIQTILLVLVYLILHTNFQDHRSVDSGVGYFSRFLP